MQFVKLKDKIEKSGLKKKYISDSLNITFQAFNNKLKGNSKFTLEEVKILTSILNITKDERDEIFF